MLCRSSGSPSRCWWLALELDKKQYYHPKESSPPSELGKSKRGASADARGKLEARSSSALPPTLHDDGLPL